MKAPMATEPPMVPTSMLRQLTETPQDTPTKEARKVNIKKKIETELKIMEGAEQLKQVCAALLRCQSSLGSHTME